MNPVRKLFPNPAKLQLIADMRQPHALKDEVTPPQNQAVSEDIAPCCVSTAEPKNACLSQTDSKNFLRTPVVAAVDGLVGFVDFVLAPDRNLFVESLRFFK